MSPRRRDRHQPAAPTPTFNPWAPRSSGSTRAPAAPSAPAPPVGGSDLRSSGHPFETTSPPSGGMPHHQGPPLAERAPVTDDLRPGGAPPRPPTSWPAARLPEAWTPPPAERRRSTALVALGAFLVGALVVGAMFASYAFGDRGEEGTETRGTTTTRPLRADGPLDIQAILDVARPSVVTIQTGDPNSVFGGAGSGVVISVDGLILTNAHVIEGAGNDITVRFSDGTVATAELVGASTGDDIALIQAAKGDLTPAQLGSSANLLVGDPVVAIGNALNLGGDPSVTSGIVSAKDRQISDENVSLDNLIQTDAAINPGNSGGPLVNANGEVVGINTAIIAGAQNVGFAIAIDPVKELIDELQAGGGDLTANTATLGVSTVDVASPDVSAQAREDYGITSDTGALIVAVQPDGAAADAGLQIGDVVVEFGEDTIVTPTDLTRAVRQRVPGDQVVVRVERRGQPVTYTITLGN